MRILKGNDMEQKWSHNWKTFDWDAVKEKLDCFESTEGAYNIDLGICREEFLEYLDWLSQNEPLELARLQLYRLLMEAGAGYE